MKLYTSAQERKDSKYNASLQNGKKNVNYILDGDLTSKIYKKQLKTKEFLKKISISNKWANKLNRYFSKEKCKQIIKLKKYLITLVVRLLEMKTVVGFYINPVRKADFTKDIKYHHGCQLICININWSCH